MEHVFLIGPGGVGKSSVGRLLAPLLGFEFVDLDEAFCDQVGPIREYLDSRGYAAYLHRNAQLFQELLSEVKRSESRVFALSSGFLATDVEADVTARNRALARRSGTSVLLMPSREFEVSLEVVVRRQLSRGLKLKRDDQVATFRSRFSAYMELGDFQIFSSASQAEIARMAYEALVPRA